jgi:hypothetical protein
LFAKDKHVVERNKYHKGLTPRYPRTSYGLSHQFCIRCPDGNSVDYTENHNVKLKIHLCGRRDVASKPLRANKITAFGLAVARTWPKFVVFVRLEAYCAGTT